MLSSISDSLFERGVGRTVSIDQAAELLNVSRRTIYNKIKTGRLLTVRTPLGSQRVIVESIHPFRFHPRSSSRVPAAVACDVRAVRS